MSLNLKSPKEDLLLAPAQINEEILCSALRYLRQTCKDDLQELGIDAIDTSGTGGSKIAKFNTSTAIAFLLGAAGLKVVKFGNRSATGNSGSSDFLEQLGFPNIKNKKKIKELAFKTGITFLNARDFYPDLVSLAPLRKSLGHPTLLNFIGPLLNPCKPYYRLMGVSEKEMLEPISKIMQTEKNLKTAYLVRSKQGLDELDPLSQNTLIEINGKEKTLNSLRNLAFARVDMLKENPSPTSASQNVETFLKILKNEDRISTAYFSIILNTGAALKAAGKVSSVEEGEELASQILKQGHALEKFDLVKGAYNELA